MGTLSELLAERRALDAQIEEAKTAIARSGESVVIDGETIDSTVNVEGELANPKDDAFLFTYEKAENGDIKNVGELTYKQLVDRFAQEATTILNQAIAAGETSVENIQEALTAALAAIGQDNASGARGQAIAAINALYSTIAEAITSANSAWNSQVSTDKSAWASQVTSDLQSLATALSNALAAIGESNSAGARGAAIEAVNEALQNALASIGTSDTTGARGAAITAIQNALNTALASWQSQVSADNTAFDNKVAQANTTIDQKVTTATTKATEASNNAALAKKWAENPEDEPVEGTGDDAEYSSKHWAKKAEANSQVPMATDTTAGKVYLSDTVEIGENEANLDKKVVNKQALHDALEDLRNDMKQTLPSPEVEYVKASTGDYGTFTLKTNYSSAFGNVKVVMTPSSADPSASDTEISVGGTTVSANDNWQITAIQTDPDAMYSDSLTAVIEVTDLKCQTPVINYDDSTYTITLQCATVGAVIHYTIDGSPVSASSPVYNGAIAITEGVTIQVMAVKDGIQNSDTVSQVCSVARVWGVMWDTSSTSTKLTRLTDANDPNNLVTEIVTSEPNSVDGASDTTGSSPFDTDTPWAEMRKRTISGTTLGAWEDESGFSLSTADVVVWLPKVWFLIKKVAAIWYYYIADNQMAGMLKHPGGGKYYGRYFTKSGYVSSTGGSALTATLTSHRTNAMAKGTGWHAGSSPERALVDLLYIVEYADWNSQQVIGHGDTSYSSSCGGTDALQYHTGHGTDNSTQYRNIENLWGYYEWLDGILFQNGQAYICTDYTKFASSITSDYVTFGTQQTSPPQNSFITDFMYDEDYSWLMFIANKGGGSDSTYVPDYVYISTSSTVFAPYVGIGNGSGGNYGLFFICVINTPDGISYASRLVYEEPSAA